MRGVRELAELARDEVGGLLADVDGVIPDPFEAARDDDHPQAPLPLRLVVREVENAFDGATVMRATAINFMLVRPDPGA